MSHRSLVRFEVFIPNPFFVLPILKQIRYLSRQVALYEYCTMVLAKYQFPISQVSDRYIAVEGERRLSDAQERCTGALLVPLDIPDDRLDDRCSSHHVAC